MVNRTTISDSIELAKRAMEKAAKRTVRSSLGLGPGAVLRKADGTTSPPVESMTEQQVEKELREIVDEVRARPELLQKSDEGSFEDLATDMVKAINRGRAGIPDHRILRQAELRRMRRLVRGR